MRFLTAFLLLCVWGGYATVAAAHDSATGVIVVAESKKIFSGSYDVHGTNRNGSKYKGKAVIAVSGNKVEMSWLITSGQTYKGKGTIKNGRMVVDFGGRYPIIYKVGKDGILYGKWDRGRASETLIPE
ncbi:MAG: hypothetical protein RIC14_12230 [Filomicrobium sp.]